MRCAAAAFLAALCGAGGVAQARVEIVVPDGGALRFGAPFALEVHRAAPAGARFTAFEDRLLQPLVVERTGATAAAGRLADGRPGTVEVLRYRAQATAAGELRLPEFVCELVHDGGRVDAVRAAVPALTVASVLPEPPGTWEWPADVRDLPRAARWPWWLGGALLALGAYGFVRRRRLRPVVAPPGGPAAPSCDRAALQALDALDDDGAFHAELAAILRDYVGRRYRVRAEVRTTEELARLVPSGGETLRLALGACDLVKFACVRRSPAERGAARDAALQFVRATAEGP